MAERILMIDDDAISRKLATHILEGKYDVICASSGAEGLQILRSSAIDLVLLDLYMLDMNGLEVLQQIREDVSISDTKVIILSFSGIRTDVIESIRLGVLDFIRKPFLASDLLERIQAALSIERKDRILVVDDDNINLKITERILRIPYDVICVSSGTEAIEYLKEHTPDLILLDLHMPDMNGLELLAKLQCKSELADIPVIFLTADNDQAAEGKILQAGAMDYIQKPFSAEVLLRRISRILELYHYQKSLQREVEKKTEELQKICQPVHTGHDHTGKCDRCKGHLHQWPFPSRRTVLSRIGAPYGQKFPGALGDLLHRPAARYRKGRCSR